jgi:hypothetical protein
VVGAILLIHSGNQSEAATLDQTVNVGPNTGMPSLVSGSLEIPMGSSREPSTPDEEPPDAGVASSSTPSSPTGVSKNGVASAGGSSVDRPEKAAPPPVQAKTSNLTEEQRQMLEKAKSLGADSSTPVNRTREGQNGSGSAKQGQPLSSDQIRDTISKNRTSIQRCYEQEMRGASGSGDLRVELRITVQPSGIVSNIQVSPSNVRGTKLASCMMSSARRWRFPSATAPSTFDAPFVLTPGRGR